MRPLLTGLFALALCAVPLQGQAGADPVAPDIVTLSFDWPVGMAARVTGSQHRAKGSGEAADTTRMEFSYDLRVREHPRGRRIDFEGFHMPGVTAESGLEARVASALGALTPSYVISLEGDLVDVTGLDEVRAMAESVLRPVLDSVGSPALEGYVAQALSREVLMAQAAEEWTSLVAAWVGAEWELGQAYELETEQALPMLGGELVPFRYEFGVLDRVACTAGEAEARCVELIMRSWPDPTAIGEFVEKFTSDLMREAAGAEAPEVVMKDLSIDNEVVLVAEPATLIPYALTITRQTRTTVEAGGVEEEASETRVQSYRYEYR